MGLRSPLLLLLAAALAGTLRTALQHQAAKEEIIQTGISKSKLKHYVLAIPVSTSADGSYISNIVSATHSRRSTRDVSPSTKQLYFNVSAFGKEFHLRLRPNTHLIAPGAVVEWYEDSVEMKNGTDGPTETITDRIWKKELLQTNCAYVGDLVDIPGASVAVSNCDGLAFSVNDECALLLDFVYSG